MNFRMVRKIFIILAVLFMGFGVTAPAFAQRDTFVPEHGNNPSAKPYYEYLVRLALLKQPPRFPFSSFRGRYYLTDHYDPIGTGAVARLLEHASIMKHSDDPVQRKIAGEKYMNLLISQLGNIEVVTQALILSKESKRFGDWKFLDWMRKGLMRSILNSGDGARFITAYEVFTLAEETTLLRNLRVRVLKTDSEETGGVYYNMHEVEEPGSGLRYTIFVNVTKPMKYLASRQGPTFRLFSLPPQ